MKSLLLLLTGAGIGIAAYVFLNEQNASLSAANRTGAWGTDKRLSGAGNSVKGSVKQGFGKLTGDESTQASGTVDKVKGSVQDAVGSIAQKVSDVANSAD